MLAAVLCYLLYVSPVPSDRVVRAADPLPASLKEEIVTGAQQLIEQGRQEGLQRGRVEGRVEGRIEGRVEGRQEALAATLLRLAHRRFGDIPAETAARIEAAPTPDLERWLEGLLTAERLNDLFG
jgi:flagellar biosynthesis/type III secretory pathway protein FliH